MSDKSLFRRNLLIIVGLHILLIGGLFYSGFFSKSPDDMSMAEGDSSGSQASSQDNSADDNTPAPTPENSPGDSGTSAPSLIVLGTPAPEPKPTRTPRLTPTPTPATPTPTPTPKRTPRIEHTPTPTPKKKPSRSSSPKPSAKKSSSPKTSPKHSASPSESAKPDDTGDTTTDNGSAATPGASASKGKTGTHTGEGDSDHGGHGKKGSGADAANQIGWYDTMIHDRIYSRWSCPAVDGEPVTIVKIRIEKDGHVSDVSLAKSSGNDIFDESAMTAAKSVTQFDPLPSAIDDTFYDVPIEFKPQSQ